MNMSKTTTMVLGAVLAGTLVAAVPVFARGPDGRCGDGPSHMQRHHNPEARLERMMQRVAMSDEQRAAVRTIVEQHQPQMDALHAKQRENRRQLANLTVGDEAQIQALAAEQGKTAEELAVLRTQMRIKIDQVLTVEQREQLKQHRDRRGQRNG
jgi:protein CpxP